MNSRNKEKKYILQSSFDQIKKAMIVQPILRTGRRYFTFFIYLSAVPSLSCKYMNEQRSSRTTVLMDVAPNVIGQCSVIKLELEYRSDKMILNLLDKLCTTQFNIWWASVHTSDRMEKSIAERRLEDDNTPWSVKWLLSEGYRVTDQLSAEDIKIIYSYQDLLYASLQALIACDIIVDVMAALKEAICGNTTSPQPVKLPELHNYTLIPKVLVTPTRTIFLPPEVVQFNRVMRQYKPENFITVSFRDEDDTRLTGPSPLYLEEPVQRIKTFLLQGLMVGGRKYEFLGCSNSQLRIHGCWMYSQDPSNPVMVEEIRQWMGDFSQIHCLAVYVARLGQFFSSSTNTIDLSGDKYTITEVADVTHNDYCFTDGVGSIAVDTANEVGCDYMHKYKYMCDIFGVIMFGCSLMQPLSTRG